MDGPSGMQESEEMNNKNLKCTNQAWYQSQWGQTNFQSSRNFHVCKISLDIFSKSSLQINGRLEKAWVYKIIF